MNPANPQISSLRPPPSAADNGGHDDGITVTDITDAPARTPAAGVLGSVLGVYEQHGYDAGYRRAVQDVLLSLLGVTEQFIRERRTGPGGATPDADDLRRIVWALQEDLERRFERENHASGFVEGGLGI